MGEHVHVVGAFEAKTHLSRLLRRVENGEEFVIQVRGRSVAWLTPFEQGGERPTLAEIIDEMRCIRAEVDGPVDIRALIEEGRRA